MPAVNFYFQVHQPFRLKNYNFFSVGLDPYYEDTPANKSIMRKVAEKSYLPMNALLLRLLKKHKGDFKVSFSITGTTIDQFLDYAPEVLDSFRALVDTGHVEIINETHNHSLVFLYSMEEFFAQVNWHKKKIEELLGYSPKAFRNTELIYNNDVAMKAEELGYAAVLAEGADHVLGWRSPTYVYSPEGCSSIKLLLKHYRLSDDIAFRFSNKNWAQYPLTPEKYASWVHQVSGQDEIVNLFMDYETFGEHHWSDTGIFEFMEELPAAILSNPDFRFTTPTEIATNYKPVSTLDIPSFTSWADAERDLSAWIGNDLQQDAIEAVYRLEEKARATADPMLIRTWRRFQTSDHFYYMATKSMTDGDVHSYFNPHRTPYDAYITYMNALADFELRLNAYLRGDVSLRDKGIRSVKTPAAPVVLNKKTKTPVKATASGANGKANGKINGKANGKAGTEKSIGETNGTKPATLKKKSAAKADGATKAKKAPSATTKKSPAVRQVQ